MSSIRKTVDFLKERYFLKTDFDLFLVFVLFAITGSGAVRIGRFILDFIGVTTENPWVFWPVRILLVFTLYQILFLVFGFILGQWKFARFFSNKMLSRFGIKIFDK